MEYSLLLESIAKYITLERHEEEYYLGLLHYKKVRKRQILLEAGDINSKAIFVNSGCLRSYAVDKNGSEHVLQFAPSGWWIVDMRSFIKQEPARMSIDAIEDSEIVILNKPDFDELHLRIPKFDRFGRILGQNAIANFQHRHLDTVSLSAMERYSNFCKLYPSLIRTLPQKQIASYIGVTPEFLSKMLNTNLIR
jgi:CRP-like cAMP-binding protein